MELSTCPRCGKHFDSDHRDLGTYFCCSHKEFKPFDFSIIQTIANQLQRKVNESRKAKKEAANQGESRGFAAPEVWTRSK
jgi:cytochrome c556